MNKVLIFLLIILTFVICGCGNNNEETDSSSGGISVLQDNRERILKQSGEIIFNKDCLAGLTKKDLEYIFNTLHGNVNKNSDLEIGNKKDILSFDDYVDTWMISELKISKTFYDQSVAKCEISKIEGDEYKKVKPYAEKCKSFARIDSNGFSNDIFKVKLTFFVPQIDSQELKPEEKKNILRHEDGSGEINLLGYYIGVSYIEKGYVLEPIGKIPVKFDDNNWTDIDDGSPIMSEKSSKNHFGYVIMLKNTGDENNFLELKKHMRESYNLTYLRMFRKYLDDHDLNVPEKKPDTEETPKRIPGIPVPEPPLPPVPPPAAQVEEDDPNDIFYDVRMANRAYLEYSRKIQERKYDEAYEYLTPQYQTRMQSPKDLEAKYEDTLTESWDIIDRIHIQDKASTIAYFDIDVVRYYFHNYKLFGKTSRHTINLRKINGKWLVDSIVPEFTGNP